MASIFNKVADAIKPGREAENNMLYGTGEGSHLRAHHNHIPGEFPETPAGDGPELGADLSAPTQQIPAPAVTATETATERENTGKLDTENKTSTQETPVEDLGGLIKTGTTQEPPAEDLGGLAKTGATEAYYGGPTTGASTEASSLSTPANPLLTSNKSSMPDSDAASTTAIRSGHAGHPVHKDAPLAAAISHAPTSSSPLASQPDPAPQSSAVPAQDSSHLGKNAALGVGAGALAGATYAQHERTPDIEPAATPEPTEFGSVANVSSTTARSFPLSSSIAASPTTTKSETVQPQTAPAFAEPVVTQESTFVQPPTTGSGTVAPSQTESAPVEQKHHYGRDAAIVGVGATAVGAAGHESGKESQPVHDSQVLNKLDPRVDSTSAEAQTQGTTSSPTTETTTEKKKTGLLSKLTGRHKHDKEEHAPKSPSDSKEHHHGRDAALVGAGAAGAYELTKEQSEHSEHSEHADDGTPHRKPSLLHRLVHGRKGEEREAPNDVGYHPPRGSAVTEHIPEDAEKEDKHHKKELEKEEKHHRKEVEKEQEAIGKQMELDEREHEKFLKEEQKLHEKEAKKSLKRDEKEAESLKKDPAVDVTAAAVAVGAGAAYEQHKHGHHEQPDPTPMAHSQTVAGTDPMVPSSTMATADPYVAAARAQDTGVNDTVAPTTGPASGLGTTDPDQTTQSAHYPPPATDDVQAIGYGTGRTQPEGGIEGTPAATTAIEAADGEQHSGVRHDSSLLNKLDPRVHTSDFEKAAVPANVDPKDQVHKARVNAIAFGGQSTFDDRGVDAEQIMHPDKGVATGETEAAARGYEPDPNDPETHKKRGLKGLFHRSHKHDDEKPGYQKQAEEFYEREKNFGADVPQPGEESVESHGSQHNKLRKPPPTY